jgi:hypothetical protein
MSQGCEEAGDEQANADNGQEGEGAHENEALTPFELSFHIFDFEFDLVIVCCRLEAV